MSNRTLSGQAAIVGIGATEFSKNSGRSEMQLAVECVVTQALADAGIDPSEVDGISTFTMDNNPEIEVFREIGGKELKNVQPYSLRWRCRMRYRSAGGHGSGHRRL